MKVSCHPTCNWDKKINSELARILKHFSTKHFSISCDLTCNWNKLKLGSSADSGAFLSYLQPYSPICRSVASGRDRHRWLLHSNFLALQFVSKYQSSVLHLFWIIIFSINTATFVTCPALPFYHGKFRNRVLNG
jgi:hypothetical protein